MADKAVVGEDAAQVGVVFENDTVHIEGFPFIPVGAVVNIDNGLNQREIVVFRPHAHADALIIPHR